MAVSRYDLRKNFEAQEANAIGTEYVRADLMPAATWEEVFSLLRHYLDLRIEYYEARGRSGSVAMGDAPRVQAELWSAVATAGTAQPNPVTALAVSGMNDVLNAQGYTPASDRC